MRRKEDEWMKKITELSIILWAVKHESIDFSVCLDVQGKLHAHVCAHMLTDMSMHTHCSLSLCKSHLSSC